MRKTGKKVLTAICMLCLFMGMGAYAAAAEPEPEAFPFYEDGDVVGFIGDSITHADYTFINYLEALSQYYVCRFPDRKIEFRNLSASGYKAVDILNIYDRDPAFRGINKAVIMLGTNEAILGFSPEEYTGAMEELVGRLMADGLAGEDILILTPPLCDQNYGKNYDAGGRQRWTFEDRLLEYMERLETKTEEWGVRYLDIHTPMAELTKAIQQEDAWNSLTRDCIHPNTTGQILLAYYMLQAQGAAQEGGMCLSRMTAPREGEIQVVRGSCTDFYRGEKGLCWTWEPETLPMAGTDALLEFRRFAQSVAIPGGEEFGAAILQVEGLAEENTYHIWMGEGELGSYTGGELAQGVDLGASENYPLSEKIWQIEGNSRQRHKRVGQYRTVWIDLALSRAEYTPEQIQAEYENWRNADEGRREESQSLAREAAGSAFRMYVLEEGYTAEELEQEAETAKREAQERAEREAEEARKAAEEEKKRQEEEAARIKEQEQASIEAWNREQREKEEAERAQEEQTQREALFRGIFLGGGAVILVAGLLFLGMHWRKKSR